ncbi:hypothetical protein WL36_02190 [Burkholderia ubonensis]|nr:hypothetical protein WL36_02190 [Burkholderia ubonensis]
MGGETFGSAGFLCGRFANPVMCPPTSFGDGTRVTFHTKEAAMSASITPEVHSTKPDYSDPSFRGALMNDHWILDDEASLAMIPASLIADVSRASNAITTIARLVHNSLCEPDMSGAEPLGKSAHLGLLDAAELVGKYLDEIADRMNETAQSYARLEDSQEA